MNRLDQALHRVSEELEALQRRWALVGGLAVSARAEPRFTRDVDLAIATADDADAEQLVYGLTRRGFSLFASLEHKRTARLATIRLRAPGAAPKGVVIDLLFASSGIEDLIVDAAERLDIAPGLTVPVARVGHLIATKLLARDDANRPRDAEDLAALLAEADEAERARAAVAVEEIMRRGFNRGRDLVGALEQLLTTQQK